MSQAGSSSSKPAQAPTSAGSRKGMSPCRLTTTSWRPSGSSAASAARMRSEPEGRSGSVSTARPPAASTASAISASPAAPRRPGRRRRPRPGAARARSSARRQCRPAACPAGGRPPSGRNEHDRVHAILGCGRRGSARRRAIWSVACAPVACQRRERKDGGRAPACLEGASARGLTDGMSDQLGFNKIAGAVLATGLAIFGLGELANIIYEYQPPAKQGYAIDDRGRGHRAPAAGARRSARLGHRRCRKPTSTPASRSRRSASPATTSTERPEHDRPQPLGRGRPPDRLASGLRLRPADEGLRGQEPGLDLRPALHLPEAAGPIVPAPR